MALVICPQCETDDDVYAVARLPEGRRRAGCRHCGTTWEYGETAHSPRPRGAGSVELAARGRFPTIDDVPVDRLARAQVLKARFLAEVQAPPDPQVAPYWRTYQELFSEACLPTAHPEALKRFATDPTGVKVGIMAEFNKAWDADPERAARSTRLVIAHLLRGPGPLEERFTRLVLGQLPYSMPGFKEALLTKTLCVVHPDRFLTVVTYARKRSMAAAVYGLELPAADKVSWTIGRLVVWSNDLLRDLVGEGFVDQQQAAQFLGWAKDEA